MAAVPDARPKLRDRDDIIPSKASRRPTTCPHRRMFSGQLALALVLVLSGCAIASGPAQPLPTPTCVLAGTCDFIVPACGPAITPEQNQYGLWYKGVPVPRNFAHLMGFQPILPTWIPTGASWYKTILVGPDAQSPNRAPLLYAGYGPWPPTSGHVGGTIFLNSVIAFDETTGAIDPLTNVDSPATNPLRIAEQYPTTVGGQPVTLVHLAFATVPGNGYQVTELLWHRGPLTLRVFGVLTGGISVDGFDSILPLTLGLRGPLQPTDYDAALLEIATSSIPYTECGQ